MGDLFSDGNVTVMVSDMDRSIKFYTQTLGLKLKVRYGNEFAVVETRGLSIGLHPASAHIPAGRQGSVSIGFGVSKIEPVMQELQKRGVVFLPHISEDTQVRLAFFHDPDNTPMYLAQEKVQPTESHV